MTKYLITLQPADYYFFGGENTFDTSRDDESRNYFVRSNLLPQQTALIGLVRHILFLNGLDFGPESFHHPDVPANDFGILKSISPLFLQQGTGTSRRFLLPASKLWLKNTAEIKVDFSEKSGESGFVGAEFQPTPRLSFSNLEKKETEDYTSKEELGKFWMFSDSSEKLPTLFEKMEDEDDLKKDNSGIFISSQHIGIDKASRMKPRTTEQKDQNPDDEAFYKQEFFRLRDGFRFAFIAEFEGLPDTSIFTTTMPFGGENRTFSIEAEEWTANLSAKIQPEKMYGSHGNGCIVLASDAFVESPGALLELCRFSVLGSQPFRSIRTPQEVYSSDLNAKNEALSNLHRGKNPRLLHLLERGSVLFPKQNTVDGGKGFSEKIEELLKKPTHFRSIGYNYFYPNNLNF